MVQYLGEIYQNNPSNGNYSNVNLTIRQNIKTTLGFEKIQPAFRPVVR